MKFLFSWGMDTIITVHPTTDRNVHRFVMMLQTVLSTSMYQLEISFAPLHSMLLSKKPNGQVGVATQSRGRVFKDTFRAVLGKIRSYIVVHLESMGRFSGPSIVAAIDDCIAQ